jgi:hypothetical protein
MIGLLKSEEFTLNVSVSLVQNYVSSESLLDKKSGDLHLSN